MQSNSLQLLLWATSDPDARAAADVVHRMTQATRRQTQLCNTSDVAQAALNDDADANLCLIYTAPEHHLACTLDAGQTLEAAAAEWRVETEALLALYRQNRARCHVFETHHLQRFSKTALSRLGLPSDPGIEIPGVWTSPDAPILRLLAQTHLQVHPDLATLAEELAASTTVLSNDMDLAQTLPLSEALSSVQAQRTCQQDQEAQTDALESKLAEQTQALEDASAGLATAEATQRRLQTELDSVRTDLARHQGMQDLLQQQNKIMLSEMREETRQSAHLAQEIDRLKQDLAHLTEERAAERTQMQADHEKERHGFEAEIARIMASRSMRLTAPLRRLMALMGRKPDA